MSRLQRPTSASGRRTLTLTLLWLVIAVSVAGFAAAGMMMTSPAPDAYALCKGSAQKAVATTTILIDATDTYSEDQRRRLQATIKDEAERLPVGGRLILLALNPDVPWEPTELAALCNPGKAEEANPFFVTRSKIEKRWQTEFGEPVARALTQAMDRPPAERSPIIISLAAVMARADFDTRAAKRRLVIVSDLLEHTRAGYSQLRGGNLWALYQASSLPRSVQLDLRHVDVAVDYLKRGDFASVQGTAHIAFWQRLFEVAGARNAAFLGLAPEPLPPAPPIPPKANLQHTPRR